MGNAISAIDKFLGDIQSRKKAAGVKVAEPLSEPGGYMGATTHPSKSIDDHTITARTGARAAENEKDVKDNREKPSVNATAELHGTTGSGKQDEHQLNIGTVQSATGEDPKVEDNFKGNKDDPGTTSIMKADDGEKYGSLRQLPFRDLLQKTAAAGDAMLAYIHTNGRSKQAAVGTNGVHAPQPSPEVKAAAAAGYDLAAAHDQTSRDAEACVQSIIKEAFISADLVADWLLKQSATDGSGADNGEDHDKPGDAASGAGGSAGMGGGPDPMGAVGGDPAVAGLPPGGPPPGGLDAAVAGMPGPGAPPGAGGAPASPEEAVHELASALVEMGIDPMMLAQTMTQIGGGGGGGGDMGGGPPPGAGGPPPPGMGGPPPDAKMAAVSKLYKAANAAHEYRRSGKFGFSAPKTARADAIRTEMRKDLHELLGVLGLV